MNSLFDYSCCGGNDETPKSHCMDCDDYPGITPPARTEKSWFVVVPPEGAVAGTVVFDEKYLNQYAATEADYVRVVAVPKQRKIKSSELNQEEIEMLDEDARFTFEINKIIEGANLTDKLIANKFSVSLPTVRRWIEGKNSPHPFAQPRIFEELRKMAEQAKKERK